MIQLFATGNLGRDAELKAVNGSSVCSFSLASSSRHKGEERTTWLDCSVWGKRAESLAPHLRKGARVAVTGELGTREHNGKTILTVRVNELDFTGGGKPAERNGAAKTPAPRAPADDGVTIDDIPF